MSIILGDSELPDNNTRCYPRTLREAFKDADYACAIESFDNPVTRIGHAAVAVVCAVGLVVFVTLLALGLV
jgi:hypothetical protein